MSKLVYIKELHPMDIFYHAEDLIGKKVIPKTIVIDKYCLASTIDNKGYFTNSTKTKKSDMSRAGFTRGVFILLENARLHKRGSTIFFYGVKLSRRRPK